MSGNNYTFALENGEANYPELCHLYYRHYGEMQTRLAAQGIPIPPYKPRLDRYFEAIRAGYLLTFVVRLDGKAVGYSNIYLTSDMHNGESIAQEDTIYIAPEHRNGVGRRLSKIILEELGRRGVARLTMTALTDLRVAKLWKRMGCREVGTVMTYIFKDNADVRASSSDAP